MDREKWPEQVTEMGAAFNKSKTEAYFNARLEECKPTLVEAGLMPNNVQFGVSVAAILN